MKRKVSVVMMKNQDSNVVSLDAFRRKKDFENSFSEGRIPLYVSHLSGKVKGNPHLNKEEAKDFSNRMQRIKLSLEKINKLMKELKKNEKPTEDR